LIPIKKTISFCALVLNSGEVDKVYTPMKNGLVFIEGVSGIVLYRVKSFQVELFICQPNCVIPQHTHPDVDSYECFLYGMKFTHSGETIIDHEEAFKEEDGFPTNLYQTIE
jgi:quercetin dioxygenase-like cupin family protein